jgi:hypothetical protein
MMDVRQPPASSAPSTPRHAFRPGDLAVSRAGYPILYEVIGVLDEGMVRVRGLNWAAGYSALVHPEDLRPTTSLLRR